MIAKVQLLVVDTLAEQKAIVDENRRQVAELNRLDAQAYVDAIRARRCRRLLLGMLAGRELNRETATTGIIGPVGDQIATALEVLGDEPRKPLDVKPFLHLLAFLAVRRQVQWIVKGKSWTR